MKDTKCLFFICCMQALISRGEFASGKKFLKRAFHNQKESEEEKVTLWKKLSQGIPLHLYSRCVIRVLVVRCPVHLQTRRLYCAGILFCCLFG